MDINTKTTRSLCSRMKLIGSQPAVSGTYTQLFFKKPPNLRPTLGTQNNGRSDTSEMARGTQNAVAYPPCAVVLGPVHGAMNTHSGYMRRSLNCTTLFGKVRTV